jgi:hypothetical protein
VSEVSVETCSRWETRSLLRKLRGHSPYAIDLGRGRWIVGSSSVSGAQVAQIEHLVTEWAREEGTERPLVLVGKRAGH